MNSLKYIIKSLLAIAVIITISGCETTKTAADNNAEEAVTLRKGMTVIEIKDSMGDPIEIIPTNILEGRGEAWLYKKTITTTSQVASHTVESEYTSPITGAVTIVYDPVLELQSTKHKFLTTLYVLDGQLIGWKQTSNTSNSIGN